MLILKTLLFITLSFNIWSAGYDKVVTWSAKWTALAGAASASVDGADALYFNPAGLSQGRRSEMALHLSPSVTQYEGPTVRDEVGDSNGPVDKSDANVVPLGGLLFHQKLNDRLGVGLGAYAAGGSAARSEKVDFTNVHPGLDELKPDVAAELGMFEVSLGAGYAVTKNLSIGGAWRATRIQGDMAGLSLSDINAFPGHYALASVEYNDLKSNNFNGFRLGSQYRSSNGNWGAGVSWRSALKFELEGRSNVRSENTLPAPFGGVVTNHGGGEVMIKNYFPQQISLGTFRRFTRRLTVFGESVWTEYSKNQELEISGEPVLIGTTNAIRNVTQNWKDQWNHKIGVQYGLESQWVLRSGYAFTTQVVPNDNANFTSSSPGVAHTITAGTGKLFNKERLHVDFAGELSLASGEGTTRSNSQAGVVSGKFKSTSYGLHTSFKYFF